MTPPTIISDDQPGPNNHDSFCSKGKQRAQSSQLTEYTPLLGSRQSFATASHDPLTQIITRRRLQSTLTLVFIFTLSFCMVAFVLLAFIGYSYATSVSSSSPEDILGRALVFKGPDRLDVLNITADGGLLVKVEGRVGLDAGSAIGAKRNGESDGFWKGIVKAVGRWGIRRLDRVSVRFSTINVSGAHDPSTTLISVDIPGLEIPLTAEPPEDDGDLSWLTAVSTPVFIQPTHDIDALMGFVRRTWQDGAVALQANTEQAIVQGGDLTGNSWRQQLTLKRSNIHIAVLMKIPPLPGLPMPGRNSPFPPISQLVTLQTFSISSSSENLMIHAQATVIDPAPMTFNFTSLPIPFIISLPTQHDPAAHSIAVASVVTEPFSLTHPNITLTMSGNVLPLPADSIPTLSASLSDYLSAKAFPILISTPLIPGLSVDTLFPAPNPKPELLRNVTIRDMKIGPTASGTFLASGTVFVRVVLPKGLKVGLNISRVLPDVLVFDGEVPDRRIGLPSGRRFVRSGPEGQSASPLPDSLPERAFGHIRPVDWLDAVCVPDDSEDSDSVAYAVSAKIVDAELRVLPGRQKEFSTFIGKVIFDSGGALAGLLGSAAIVVDVQGLPIQNGDGHEIELSGLPLHGSIRIGKKGFLGVH